MYARVLSFSLIIILFNACGGEPEVDEFTQLRLQMQQRQNDTFSNSVKDLENRKNKSYKRKYISSKSLNKASIEEEKKLEAERQRWLSVDIKQEEAEEWKALGLTPKRAQRWKKTGLSYNTIGVLLKEDVLPAEAVSFMNKKFTKNPKAFSRFAEPLYDFLDSCKKIINTSDEKLVKINKKCNEYIELLNLSSVSGYMADEYGDNDLALEYISKLRQVDNHKAFIQKEMNKKSKLCLIDGDKHNFTLLFPLLTTAPSKEDMFFIKQNKLALMHTQRYKSYEYYDFWVKKEQNEEKARVAAIKKQHDLKIAKQKRLKAESYRLKALAYNKMVASECGEMVTSVPSTGEKVHIEGKVKHIIGKLGSNIFAYVIKNNKDAKSYLVRDPSAKHKMKVDSEISWTVLTVGRVVSVSLDDDGTASYNHYSDDEKEYYPMLKKIAKCEYHTKSLAQ